MLLTRNGLTANRPMSPTQPQAGGRAAWGSATFPGSTMFLKLKAGRKGHYGTNLSIFLILVLWGIKLISPRGKFPGFLTQMLFHESKQNDWLGDLCNSVACHQMYKKNPEHMRPWCITKCGIISWGRESKNASLYFGGKDIGFSNKY